MYVFLATAPCKFTVAGESYQLTAGSTFTIRPELGEQLLQNTFPYRKHLRLMSKLDKAQEVSKEEVEVEVKKAPEVKSEPKPVEVKLNPKVQVDPKEAKVEESKSKPTRRSTKKTEE